MPKQKEKREEVLYCKVKASNKKWHQKEAKRLGYTNFSEYVDDLLEENKKKGKK